MNLKDQSSESLAAKIVAFRVLNIFKEESIEAMQILMQRKADGDTFDYSKYIEDKIKELPKPQISAEQSVNIKNLLKNVKSGSI